MSEGVETAYADIKPRALGQRSNEPRRATAGEGGAGGKHIELCEWALPTQCKEGSNLQLGRSSYIGIPLGPKGNQPPEQDSESQLVSHGAAGRGNHTVTPASRADCIISVQPKSLLIKVNLDGNASFIKQFII